MITIPVTVTGDHWLNPEQVQTSLALSDPQESIVLDICAEGPSLWRLGVIDMVLAHCEHVQRETKTVYISRWSNPVEHTPFQRTHRSDISHFYWGSDRYWPDEPIPCAQDTLWGFFMGRPTMSRLVLLHQLTARTDVLLSRMVGGVIPDAKGTNLDLQEFDDSKDLILWYHQCGIPSLDGSTIRDQYDQGKNTNRSLLRYYDQFHIEIVAESYVYGDTFFPTEKTVRPLAAGKPIVVMGPKYFLRRLRDQGFRTWAHLWDEGYDDLEGRSRVQAILELIKDVTKRSPKILAGLSQYADHNRHTLIQLINKHRPGP